MSSRKPISKSIQATVFLRDNWCCRYCGVEVFFSPALKVLADLSPGHGYYHRNGKKDKMSSLLLNRCAAVDHINPVSSGGTNEIDNLISACWECNTRKSNSDPAKWINRIIPLEDLNLANNWDGFLSLVRKFDSGNVWLKYFPNA